MSFPALNNTSDYDVFTSKYLQNLALQIQLNQNNLDKNISYIRTGVQDTERTDSRSIEERAGDVETLKIQARVMLSKLTDSTNTYEVLNYLAKNSELLFFFIQQFPAIEEIVKKQYTGGIRAPILISLIYKRFISQQEDSLMPESADFNIVSNLLTRQDADILLSQTNNPELINKLISLARVLPLKDEIKKLIDDPIGNRDEIKFLAEMFRNSPNIKDYNKLTEEYNDAPLKDERTNYDLEEAEDMMIELITSFLVERQAFQNDIYNQKRMRQIDKINLKRTTKSLPVAKDNRVARTSEQQRATIKEQRRTSEQQMATARVQELFESVNKFQNVKKKSTTEKERREEREMADTKSERQQEAKQQAKEIAKQQDKIDKLQELLTEKKQEEEEEMKEYQRFEMRKMDESDTRASEKKQEAKQRELQRITNEMEQLKLEKQKEEADKIAKEKKYKQMSKLEDNPNEPEKIDEYNQIVKRRPGRPFGSKDKNPRDRTSKKQMSLARRLEALQQPIYPETPTEIEEKALARRLEGLQQPTLPKAPTTTPKKKIKVVQTGTGLLNQHERITHRFKVLKGEILAGNTASEVIKEMKSLVKQLVKSGELSLEQQSGILKELKTL